MIRALTLLLIALLVPNAPASNLVLPGKMWNKCDPAAVGMDAAALHQIAKHLDGSGVITKNGWKVFTWGQPDRPREVASAVKPLFTHFLIHSVETGKLPGFDAPVSAHEPRLKFLNPALAHKDQGITFRHMANQVSCYGVAEQPGTAFNYNDYQMTLFADTLFGKVLGIPYDRVNQDLLHPHLGSVLQFQDPVALSQPVDLARNGRLLISPRDFCRFGLLYLNNGKWGDRQLLQPHHVQMVTRTPVSAKVPRTTAREAEMIPGQRSLGSRRIPDDHIDHLNSYSWAWWANGERDNGSRLWPDATECTFAALGHKHGMRGLAVIPAWGIVFSWNDTLLSKHQWPDKQNDPHPLNEVFRLLRKAGAGEG